MLCRKKLALKIFRWVKEMRKGDILLLCHSKRIRFFGAREKSGKFYNCDEQTHVNVF